MKRKEGEKGKERKWRYTHRRLIPKVQLPHGSHALQFHESLLPRDARLDEKEALKFRKLKMKTTSRGRGTVKLGLRVPLAFVELGDEPVEMRFCVGFVELLLSVYIPHGVKDR